MELLMRCSRAVRVVFAAVVVVCLRPRRMADGRVHDWISAAGRWELRAAWPVLSDGHEAHRSMPDVMRHRDAA
jgi:hypothetical protein